MENYVAMNRQREREARRIRRKITDLVVKAVLILIIMMLMYLGFKEIFTRPEKYSPIDRTNLERRIEQGDEEAISDYMKYFVSEDIYFDVSINIDIFADEFDIDEDVLEVAFESMDVSYQEFHDKYLQDENIIKFLQKSSEEN